MTTVPSDQHWVPTAEPGAASDVPAPPTVAPSALRTTRQRRPSGAAPPLPRHLGTTGRGWLVALVLIVGWLVLAHHVAWARRLTDQVDAAVLRAVAEVRTDWLSTIARGIDRIATGWAWTVAALVLIVVTVVCKRWQHLFAFLASVVVLEVVGLVMIQAFRRPRPYDVTAIGRWQGYALPSATAAIVSFTVVGYIYMLVVAGRPRRIAKGVGIGVVTIVVLARVYLGVDHPTDVLAGVVIGVTFPLVAFRFFTPNEVFPVRYGGGKRAHLDVGGRRGEALRAAVEEQLGVTVLDVRPVGLGGSGGSTPLRIRLAGEPDTYVFGKLYAMNHVRADRWYKTGRTILYGRLEDEAPFQTVRRLVQYEDYAMRVMRDAGVPTAAPLGIVELTPEREYLLVAEFFDGSVEIGDADVDDQIIDDGLRIVRRLWQAGLAHRDIKPANLLVQDGRLIVIDVAFAQVRPSAWRQAIDLANMMLVLAVRTDAQRVYDHALRYFSPDEIAEAFAAARGIASPSQLRSVLKRDGRDLVAEFRRLAPPRERISLQRWGPRRVLLGLGVVALAVLATTNVFQMFTPAELPIGAEPSCGTSELMVLSAQAVPSAPGVPCLAALPAGWSVGGTTVRRGLVHFWLDSDRAGDRALEVRLRPGGTCAVDDDTQVPSDEVGWRRFESAAPGTDGRTTRVYVRDGACVTYELSLDEALDRTAAIALDGAVSFQPRFELVAAVEDDVGLSLCGVGAPPCVGGAE